MIKVSMNLTKRDVDNVAAIHECTQARTKAQAVSTALSLTRFVIDQLVQHNAELLIRTPKGDLERVVMPELQNLRPYTPHHEAAAG